MSFLLQFEGLNAVPFSHCTFHFCGTGDIPSSLKFSLSGQIPVSIMPTITSSDVTRNGNIVAHALASF